LFGSGIKRCTALIMKSKDDRWILHKEERVGDGCVQEIDPTPIEESHDIHYFFIHPVN
jgi:hypothetical protein